MRLKLKIQTTDLEKARDITQWLIKNVGPQTAGAGSIIRGEGWMFWVAMPKPLELIVHYEIDESIVDEHTVTMFLLKWS